MSTTAGVAAIIIVMVTIIICCCRCKRKVAPSTPQSIQLDTMQTIESGTTPHSPSTAGENSVAVSTHHVPPNDYVQSPTGLPEHPLPYNDTPNAYAPPPSYDDIHPVQPPSYSEVMRQNNCLS